ncbi:MAG TPA: phosphoglucosamine mutase [Candidatus Acidoferrales bacterium]|nr:phosphoglucosamine mutase [Candidatus Acidoferrales bacterium]
MAKQLFGTDGIRGVAGEAPLDRVTIYAFGVALGRDLAGAGDAEVLIGADTRESSPWMAALVAGGLNTQGVRARYAGVITTPGVAYLTRTSDFAAGVMISASHNPYHDNGLKVFGHTGFKLPDEEEHNIEQEIFRLLDAGLLPRPASLEADPTLARRYLDFLISTTATRFDGVRLVIDCGNGASYLLAPELFRALGAQAEAICCQPDGRNINLNCGALHLSALQQAVVSRGADLGVAFDGDADRAIFVSASGKIVDGDAILLAAGRALKAEGGLAGDIVVSTVMSNLGLERALTAGGIRMVRTPVGDKYVLEEMVRLGASLGGEQSGHVIFRQYSTTGDGMLTAIRLIEIARRSSKSLDELTSDLEIYPQRLVNVRVREKKSLTELPSVASEIRRVEEAFGGAGRVLVRFSGTEPLARVMVEGPDPDQVERFSASIADAIRREMGA